MNILKKLLAFIIVFILLLHTIQHNAYAIQNNTTQNSVKVAVFLDSFNELFLSNFKENLENIQKENENKVQFTFFDSNGNQGTENDNINNALNQNFDLFVVNPVSLKIEEFKSTFNKIVQKNIPIIIFAPPSKELANFIITYPRTVIIGGDDEQSGILQGNILIHVWNTNKKSIDKNKDNIMQYVMIHGQTGNPATIARTKYSIQALNDAGIKTQKLSSTACDLNRKCARDTMEANFLQYHDSIEVIIASSDDMAIGAIEALQKYGFNKGDNSKYIPVVGIGGLPEAKELIKQGAMAGTVIQDSRDYANAVYTVGMNLVSGTNPLDGINYKFDDTEKTIRIPYYEDTELQ